MNPLSLNSWWLDIDRSTPQKPQVVVVQQKASPILWIILGLLMAMFLCVAGICAVGGLGLGGLAHVANEVTKWPAPSGENILRVALWG